MEHRPILRNFRLLLEECASGGWLSARAESHQRHARGRGFSQSRPAPCTPTLRSQVRCPTSTFGRFRKQNRPSAQDFSGSKRSNWKSEGPQLCWKISSFGAAYRGLSQSKEQRPRANRTPAGRGDLPAGYGAIFRGGAPPVTERAAKPPPPGWRCRRRGQRKYPSPPFSAGPRP